MRRQRKIKARDVPFALPSESEIANARDEVCSNEDIDIYPPRSMGAWEGVGWHKDEIYYGILVGLQIARNREVKSGKKAHNTATNQARPR